MKLLALTKGYYALVDDDDYYWVSQFNWSAIEVNGNVYARRNKKKGILKSKEPYEIYLHRVIMRCSDKSKVIDHIDHNGLNCQKNNLRICNADENKRNIKSYTNSSSNFLGVSYDKARNKWVAQLTHNGNKILNKRFNTESEAAMAYDIIAKKHHGKFANLNFK
jgi:hypothetical protein